jgi:hypothetical protein
MTRFDQAISLVKHQHQKPRLNWFKPICPYRYTRARTNKRHVHSDDISPSDARMDDQHQKPRLNWFKLVSPYPYAHVWMGENS